MFRIDCPFTPKEKIEFKTLYGVEKRVKVKSFVSYIFFAIGCFLLLFCSDVRAEQIVTAVGSTTIDISEVEKRYIVEQEGMYHLVEKKVVFSERHTLNGVEGETTKGVNRRLPDSEVGEYENLHLLRRSDGVPYCRLEFQLVYTEADLLLDAPVTLFGVIEYEMKFVKGGLEQYQNGESVSLQSTKGGHSVSLAQVQGIFNSQFERQVCSSVGSVLNTENLGVETKLECSAKATVLSVSAIMTDISQQAAHIVTLGSNTVKIDLNVTIISP